MLFLDMHKSADALWIFQCFLIYPCYTVFCLWFKDWKQKINLGLLVGLYSRHKNKSGGVMVSVGNSPTGWSLNSSSSVDGAHLGKCQSREWDLENRKPQTSPCPFFLSHSPTPLPYPTSWPCLLTLHDKLLFLWNLKPKPDHGVLAQQQKTNQYRRLQRKK